MIYGVTHFYLYLIFLSLLSHDHFEKQNKYVLWQKPACRTKDVQQHCNQQATLSTYYRLPLAIQISNQIAATLLIFYSVPTNKGHVTHRQNVRIWGAVQRATALQGKKKIHASYFILKCRMRLDFQIHFHFRFGVCCYFRRDSAGELNQNCTYIQNPGFPSKYSETNALTYTIKKCSDG